MQDMRIEEVRVFGDDDALLIDRYLVNEGIFCRIPGWKLTCMDGVVPVLSKNGTHPTWELRIDQKVHVSARCTLFAASILRENSRQARISSRSRSGNSASTCSTESPPRQIFEDTLDGIPQPTDAGLPMTHSRINRDA